MIEIVRYYLEIKSLNDLKSVSKPNQNCFIKKLSPPDHQLNKFFYKQIGKNHRWIDRLSWKDTNWIEYLSNSDVETHVLTEKESLVGYYESIYEKKNDELEIAYFGILEDCREKGYGSYLLSEAIKESLKRGVKRVWVHTCTLDHKNAIKNYTSRGMKVFKEDKIKISA